MWKNICVLRQETLIYRKARRHLANHRSVPVLLSTIHCGEILQNPSGRIAAEFIKLFIPVILHGHSDNMLLNYKGVWTGRTGRQSSEHEIIVAEKQAGTQPFHPFASGDERVQTSFLKSAQPGRLLGLPPSTILLPVDGNDWCRFCAVLCAWNTEKEEKDDKPSGPPSLRNTRSPEETANKNPNQTKTLSCSVFARVLKNTDNSEIWLRENKTKQKCKPRQTDKPKGKKSKLWFV